MKIQKIINIAFLIIYFIFFKYKNFLKNTKQKTNKILIIQLDNLGDFIIFNNFILNFKEIYKKKEVFFLAKSEWSNFLKDHFENVIDFDEKRFLNDHLYCLKIIKELYKNKFEIVFNPNPSKIFFGDLFFFFSNSNRKIHQQKYEIYSSFFLKLISKEIKLPESEKHELKIYSNFFKKIFTKEMLNGHLLNNPENSFSGSKVSLPQTISNNKYVVFSFFSGNIRKDWPLDRYVEIVKLVQKSGYKCVIVGLENEYEIVSRHLDQVSNIINLCGKTNLSEVLKIIQNSRFIVSNDTAIAHMAKIYNKDFVCILSGVDFGKYFPYGDESNNQIIIHKKNWECFNCNWNCKYKLHKNDAFPCISEIQTFEINEAVNKLLNNDNK